MKNEWSDAELSAALEAYQNMAEKEASGVPYNKAKIYSDLSERFERTEKSFEYRMQNISALYEELGLPWIPGLKPAANIGRNVKLRLINLLKNNQPKFKHGNKRTWELALDAVKHHNGIANKAQVTDWIKSNYPDYNKKNDVDLNMLSVNYKPRTSYSQNKKERRTDSGSPYDKLYMTTTGTEIKFCLYSPEIHGVWEIYRDYSSEEPNKYSIRQIIDPITEGLKDAREEAEAVDDFSPHGIEDARRKVFAQIIRRQGQSTFRNSLIKAYEGSCAITGCNFERLLEAAHVLPYKGIQTNVVSNGILLRTDIHTLFDLHLISIDSKKMTVEVSPELSSTEYARLGGKQIFIPNKKSDEISVDAINWHRNQCAW